MPWSINRSTVLKRLFDAVLLVAVVYAALLAFGVIRRGSQFSEGTVAPDVTVRALEDGSPIAIGTATGKPTLLVFFSVGCPACRRELPDIQELRDQAGDRLNVLVVSADAPQELQAYMKAENLKLPVGVDSGSAHRSYQVSTIPYAVIIDGQGKVRSDFVGAVHWSDVEPLLPAES